jgi:hypothetical protein
MFRVLKLPAVPQSLSFPVAPGRDDCFCIQAFCEQIWPVSILGPARIEHPIGSDLFKIIAFRQGWALEVVWLG